MLVKIAVAILAFLNGGWMLFDGFHVLAKGKYFGPEKPGPWSDLIAKTGVDPFKIGPLFLIIGALWILFIVGLIANQQWSWLIGVLTCIITLWYLPIGTVISCIVLLLLLIFRGKILGK